MQNKIAGIVLRPTQISDLEVLFLFQRDQEGQHLAAFMPTDTADKPAYIARHTHLIDDPTITYQTILFKNRIVGSIAAFILNGHTEITYWLDRSVWGRGIATEALGAFLKIEQRRPLYGRVAFDNVGSHIVLGRGGFIKTGVDKGFANARHQEIEEFIFRLD